ncbi:hypothetical protein HanRHA438_Chr11g0485841 [Helianthus annuus]|nr:hypothetical protein HanRHA438_Chr11g0485841 [Helianthus annuus]
MIKQTFNQQHQILKKLMKRPNTTKILLYVGSVKADMETLITITDLLLSVFRKTINRPTGFLFDSVFRLIRFLHTPKRKFANTKNFEMK